jgi:heparin binding hemagglutinin HbhA
MTTNTTTRKIPTPFYAAAGAGDFAYQRLRRLPEQVQQLRGRAVAIAPAVTAVVAETNVRADLDRLRGAARRNAAQLAERAQSVSERAVSVYSDLVSRGEQVMRGARTTGAAIEVAPATGTVRASSTSKRAAAATPATPAKKSAAKKAAAKKA